MLKRRRKTVVVDRNYLMLKVRANEKLEYILFFEI